MTETHEPARGTPQILADSLVAATLAIGENARRVRERFDRAGMPGEYRGALAGARDAAESFLRRQPRVASGAVVEIDRRIALAESVVQLTHAIVFAMKHGLEYKLIFESAVGDLTTQLEAIDPALLDRKPASLTGS